MCNQPLIYIYILQQIEEHESESEGEDPIPLAETSDEADGEFDKDEMDDLVGTVKTGDYVVVKFATKKTVKHFVGLVLTADDMEVQVTYFKRNGKHFQPPEAEDVSFVPMDDVVMKLPQPQFIGAASRAGTKLSFGVDFTHFQNI
jgi:hypothetical protein